MHRIHLTALAILIGIGVMLAGCQTEPRNAPPEAKPAPAATPAEAATPDAIQARRVKPQELTARERNYDPAQGELLATDQCGVQPARARVGESIAATVQYALLGTGGGSQVLEARSLRRGDHVVADLGSRSFTRSDGTWLSTQTFRLPAGLAPGAYTVYTEISTAKSRISESAALAVE